MKIQLIKKKHYLERREKLMYGMRDGANSEELTQLRIVIGTWESFLCCEIYL